MDEDNNTWKRYQLLITLVVILLAIGIGCWMVKKREPHKTDVRKDEVLRQLDQRNK